MRKFAPRSRQSSCRLLPRLDSTAASRCGHGWSSGNWSGYAQTGAKGAFARISAQWTVPFVKPTKYDAYSSAWIGIDGFTNSKLIQTGTAHEYENGKVRYYAWWEILPEAETVIPLPVHPGDCIRAAIGKLARGRWLISLTNVTRGWTFRTVRRYSGPQTSAEWIVEAPQIGPSIARMARLTPVTFARCRVNGASPRLKRSQGGNMNQRGVIVSIPSCPNRAGDAFVVRGRKTQGSSTVYYGKTGLKPRRKL